MSQNYLNEQPYFKKDYTDPNLEPFVSRMSSANKFTNNGNTKLNPMLIGAFATIANEARNITKQYQIRGNDDSLESNSQQAIMRANSIQAEYEKQRSLEKSKKDLQELKNLFAETNTSGVTQVSQPKVTTTENKVAQEFNTFDDYYDVENSNFDFKENSTVLSQGLNEEDRLFFDYQFSKINDTLLKILSALNNEKEPTLEEIGDPIILNEDISNDDLFDKEEEQ